jgi:ElaB/YqjD/DUF883 family membrane-anchored ribosome-binding protein
MTTISNTADHAAEQMKDAASHARGTLLDLAAQAMKLVHGAREAESRGVDTLLDRMGLQRRRSGIVPVLWFAAGAIVAGGVVLLLAPESGKSLRKRIAGFLDDGNETIATKADGVEHRVEETVRHDVPVVPRPTNGTNKHAK